MRFELLAQPEMEMFQTGFHGVLVGSALVQPLRHSAPAFTSNSGQGATSTVRRPDSRIPHCSEQ